MEVSYTQSGEDARGGWRVANVSIVEEGFEVPPAKDGVTGDRIGNSWNGADDAGTEVSDEMRDWLSQSGRI